MIHLGYFIQSVRRLSTIMANEKIEKNSAENEEVEATTGEKVSSRRAFTASLATLGAVGILSGSAEAGEGEESVKNKILDRIKSEMSSDRQPVVGQYLKVGGQYLKGKELEVLN
jgi:hypothetical protein